MSVTAAMLACSRTSGAMRDAAVSELQRLYAEHRTRARVETTKLNACRPWVPASWRLLRLGRRTVLDLRAARGL